MPKRAATPPQASPAAIETLLNELERQVEQLESGQLPLEEAIATYRRGSEIVLQAQTALDHAEQEIKILDMATQRLKSMTPESSPEVSL